MAIDKASSASSNYVSTAASTWNQPGRTITVMCWARAVTSSIAASQYYTVLGTHTSASASGWGVSQRGDPGGGASQWECFFSADGSAFTDKAFTNSIVTARWDHVTWVIRSDGSIVGYLNGASETLQDFGSSGSVPPATSRAVQIGWGDAESNGTFGGSIGYVRIFDGELGAAEVRQEMYSRRARNKRVPCILDHALESAGTSGIVSADASVIGTHVTSVTGTVTWTADPPLFADPITALSRIRLIGSGSAGASTNANAECATLSVAANDATPAVAPAAEAVAVAAAANDAAPKVAPASEVVTLTAAAQDAAPAVAPASQATTLTAAAQDATTAVAVNAECVTLTVAAQDPTVLTGTVVNAECAALTATANDTTSQVATASEAVAVAVAANDAAPAVNVHAECATLTAAAQDPTVLVGAVANAECAALTMSALDPALAILATAEAALVLTQALNATVQAGLIAAGYLTTMRTSSGLDVPTSAQAVLTAASSAGQSTTSTAGGG